MFLTLTNFWALILEIQLFLFAAAFLSYVKRREHFLLRAVICMVVCFALAYFYPRFSSREEVLRVVISTAKYVFLALLVFFASKICFEISWMSALFVATSSYAMQHLSSELESLALNGLTALFHIEGDTFVPQLILTIIFPLLLGWAVHFCMRQKRTGEFRVRSVGTLILMLGVIVVDIVLSSMRGRALRGIDNETLKWIITLLSLIASFLIVAVLFFLIQEGDLKNELVTINAILKKEQEQWERSKELIEAVNIKSHDLKYRLRAARKDGSIDVAMLKEIEKDVDLYEATIHTGNEAVDVLLNERLAFCKSHNIVFTTMVDGECLSFIELSDLYSLLGNALSNSIEAVLQIQEHEKRVVNLIIKKQRGFASIHLENYFTKVEEGPDGSLLTTKADKQNHGFGVKSMTLIVEKYGGTMSITHENEIFIVDILLPAVS